MTDQSRRQIQNYSNAPDVTPGFARATETKLPPDPSGKLQAQNFCTACGQSVSKPLEAKPLQPLEAKPLEQQVSMSEAYEFLEAARVCLAAAARRLNGQGS